MTHNYEIIPATARHLTMIARRIRADDQSEIIAGGEIPRHLIFSLWQQSIISRAGFVDGDIAAVWGCAGTLMSPVGHMWLVTAPAIERVPVAFAKEARAMLREMLEVKHTLYSGCIEGYEKSLRLWSMLGFKIGEAVPIPPNGAMFRLLTMER